MHYKRILTEIWTNIKRFQGKNQVLNINEELDNLLKKLLSSCKIYTKKIKDIMIYYWGLIRLQNDTLNGFSAFFLWK